MLKIFTLTVMLATLNLRSMDNSEKKSNRPIQAISFAINMIVKLKMGTATANQGEEGLERIQLLNYCGEEKLFQEYQQAVKWAHDTQQQPSFLTTAFTPAAPRNKNQ